MYDYSRLPTLVLNEIFCYLSVKERVRCKGVCRSWRMEIELREQKSDTLVLHLGPYPWNMHWTQTNNRRLMKFENSLQMKRLKHLKHPMTRTLLKKTKKLATLFSNNDSVEEASSILPYLRYFSHCEQIEFESLFIEGTLAFDLPKLKVLVINGSTVDKLVLNCPSLEVFFSNWKMKEVDFRKAKKLKRLICFGWPATVSLNGKFDALEFLDLFTAHDERVGNRLLDLMPKLKRLVLYSSDPQADLEIIREQQKRLGLKNLEVLFNGFRDPVNIELDSAQELIRLDHSVEQLFENYSKLVENSPWRVWIDYSKLFSKFKMLPSNFFERFHEPLEISAVPNYTHLLGFLKCCPFVEQLKVHSFSKVKGERILDMMHSLHPTFTLLSIVEERPSDLEQIDLSFIRLFDLPRLCLQSKRIPVEFVRKVAARRGPHLVSFVFEEITHVRGDTGGFIGVFFKPEGPFLYCPSRQQQYSNIERLISDMQSDPALRAILQ